jgi:hypothetical protein
VIKNPWIENPDKKSIALWFQIVDPPQYIMYIPDHAGDAGCAASVGDTYGMFFFFRLNAPNDNIQKIQYRMGRQFVS